MIRCPGSKSITLAFLTPQHMPRNQHFPGIPGFCTETTISTQAVASTLAADHLYKAQNIKQISPAALLCFGASPLLLKGLPSGTEANVAVEGKPAPPIARFPRCYSFSIARTIASTSARQREREQALVLATNSGKRCTQGCLSSHRSTSAIPPHAWVRPHWAAATTCHKEGAQEGTNRVGPAFPVHPQLHPSLRTTGRGKF